MYYVYILKSSRFSETYVGFTDDLRARIHDHNSGKSLHTAKFKPWNLVNYFAFNNKRTAARFEKYLKSGSGRAFARKHLL